MSNSERPRGRYRGNDALSRWSTLDWDDATRDVVRARCEDVPPFRFLTPDQAELLEAIVARIVPQDERDPAHQVPVARRIDEKLYDDVRDGYRYERLPVQREAWRLGLRGIDETAHARYGRGFVALDDRAKDCVLEDVQHGTAAGATWRELPPRLFFAEVLCSTIVGMYYAHPLAWREIGYSGPAAVRGHVRKWTGGVDPWEPRELPAP